MSARARFKQLLAEAPSDAPAIEFEGEWTTWGTLRSVATSLDAALTAAGLGEHSRVGLILENRPEHVAALMCLLATDRTVVTLSPLQPPARLSADMTRSDLPAVVGTVAMLDQPGVREAAASALVVELGAETATAAGSASVRAKRPEDVSPGVVIEMLTSGTTGPPKRVLIREEQFDKALSTSVTPPPTDRLFRSGVTIVMTPMVHIGGFWGAMAPLYAGRCVALFAKFALEPWVEAVAKHRPRAAGLVPAALRAVLNADVPAEKISSLEAVTSGTTFCPTELIDAFLEKYGIRVLSTYGATEFAGAVAVWTKPLHEQWWETKAGAAGRPMPGVTLRVTGPEGEELPVGEMGILEVKSVQSPAGPDAWQRTSDLAVLDEDGFLWLKGRADDAIIRGGFKVQPETVKAALERHEAVLEAAIAPLPDERLGFVPVAAVELRPEASATTGAELRDFCRDVLLPYEVPAHVIVVDALPRTPSSKVSRVELLEQIRAALSHPVPA